MAPLEAFPGHRISVAFHGAVTTWYTDYIWFYTNVNSRPSVSKSSGA